MIRTKSSDHLSTFSLLEITSSSLGREPPRIAAVGEDDTMVRNNFVRGVLLSIFFSIIKERTSVAHDPSKV